MTYDFTLNLPRHLHRLLLTTRTDPLDIGYTNVHASSESLASADTVSALDNQRSKVKFTTCLLVVYK